jgi:short-subunit dehydrogenase
MAKESFEKKGVVLTGGSRGLGLALAFELAAEGARIVLLARERTELERAKQMILTRFPDVEVHILECDMTERSQLTKVFSEIEILLGEIAMWINNAGAILVGPFDSLVEADFRAQMELHLFAVLSATRLVLEHFRKYKIPGRIVNISSLGGKVAVPHMLTYDTSKFALAGFSQGLMAEVAGENISVTSVYPTVIQTGSPIQAVFKGDHEKEFAWFATSDTMPGVSLRADRLAKQIVQAARNRQPELVPSFMARLRLAAGVLFPEMMAKTNKAIAASLPQGQSLRYKTGAESRALFDRSTVGKKLKKKAALREAEFNQKAKADPRFNLGLKNKKSG